MTKELLSAVLDIQVYEILERENQFIVFNADDGMGKRDFSINIYELAHKCKEFAWTQGYCISSYKSKRSDTWVAKIDEVDDYLEFTTEGLSTEPEAVFTATQRIMYRKDK